MIGKAAGVSTSTLLEVWKIFAANKILDAKASGSTFGINKFIWSDSSGSALNEMSVFCDDPDSRLLSIYNKVKNQLPARKKDVMNESMESGTNINHNVRKRKLENADQNEDNKRQKLDEEQTVPEKSNDKK